MSRPDPDLPAGGRIVGGEHRFPLRVYFEDTDLSGIVYHANYLRYMERARSDMLRLAGIDQRAHQEAGGGAYAVTALAIRYRAPARLDDALLLLTKLVKVRAASVDIHQRVMRGREILTEADVTAALVAASGRPARQPRMDRCVHAHDGFGRNTFVSHLVLNTDATALSPIALFLQADWVVKGVMIGLLLASIWTWAIILGSLFRLGSTRRKIEQFERDFWKAADIDAFHRTHADNDLPISKVFAAGVTEWRRSTAGGHVDREGTRERLATSMGAAVAGEVDELSDRLNVLATVGSVAPFVGLFGTVWGIMHTFTEIASKQNTSLVTVGPGIAEALFATAIGLFAAIPAVIAYNRFSHAINRIEARLNRFADGFHATLSRQLESEGRR